jgi:hypothetical protein
MTKTIPAWTSAATLLWRNGGDTMNAQLSPTDAVENHGSPHRYGFRGACLGVVFGALLSGGLFWLTNSYISWFALPIVAAYGYWLRPGIRSPGPLKSRW